MISAATVPALQLAQQLAHEPHTGEIRQTHYILTADRLALASPLKGGYLLLFFSWI